ncbi:MAG TPA: lipoprotein-releasing ABC transporter permease subunit, partial [Steroidobacteraceae bacterium]|nr:lipoprotein-releasing ABC transporter permease subunit [Steroidobacteraceae bacterium]
FFVSLITWVSVGGVALGVAALLVILSVMNGFEDELRDRLLSLNAHARVIARGVTPPADQIRSLTQRLQPLPGVVAVAPYIELTGLIVHLPTMLPVELRGIDPALERGVADVQPYMIDGSLASLTPGSNAVILERDVAAQLDVKVGDHVTLLVPMADADGMPEPRLREFTVGGVFAAGLGDFENSLVLCQIEDARALAPEAQGAGGVRVRFRDALQTEQFMPAVRAAAGDEYTASDWTQDNANYFRAIRIEKTMMALILMLIVGVAAFNIVAMLVMVVNDKRTDIAILRTLGASPSTVMRAFMTQGLVIAWFGVAAGLALGILMAHNVTPIVDFLQNTFHFQIFDADVYDSSDIPSDLHRSNVIWIGALTAILTLASTVYPAIRAARTPPADALRYE